MPNTQEKKTTSKRKCQMGNNRESNADKACRETREVSHANERAAAMKNNLPRISWIRGVSVKRKISVEAFSSRASELGVRPELWQ